MKCHDGLPSVKWNRSVCVALYMHLDGMNDFSLERVIENVVITLSDDMSLFHWHNPQQGYFSMSYKVGLNDVAIHKKVVKTTHDVCRIG